MSLFVVSEAGGVIFHLKILPIQEHFHINISDCFCSKCLLATQKVLFMRNQNYIKKTVYSGDEVDMLAFALYLFMFYYLCVLTFVLTYFVFYSASYF